MVLSRLYLVAAFVALLDGFRPAGALTAAAAKSLRSAFPIPDVSDEASSEPFGVSSMAPRATGPTTSAVLAPEVGPSSAPPETFSDKEKRDNEMAASLPARAKSSPADANVFVGVAKPKIDVKFHSIMFQFSKQAPSRQRMCRDVAEEMETHASTLAAGRYLETMAHMCHDLAYESAGESITADKSMENLLVEINTQMGDRDAAETHIGEHQDLLTYMEDVVTCVADQRQNHTLLEQFAYLGLENSVKTAFAQNLFKGTHAYKAIDHKDKDGNNLLHLAVLSGADHMPKAVYTLIDKMHAIEFQNSSEGIMTGVWWLLSALVDVNDEGKNPLECCRSSVVADQLKRQFRNSANYVKWKMRYLSKSMSDAEREEKQKLLDDATNLLKTAKSVNAFGTNV